MTPNWLMNLTFSHLGITDGFFIISMWFGLMPWNFLVCEAGEKIKQFKSKKDILNPWFYSKLVYVMLIFLLLGYLKKRILKEKKIEDNPTELG